MSDDWYARPVLFVADVERSIAFYTQKLGFREAWRHVEDGVLYCGEVERNGCNLQLSCQWPDKNGRAMMFISLDGQAFDAALPKLKAAGAREGQWGYHCQIVTDPDGNELFFPYPTEPKG